MNLCKDCRYCEQDGEPDFWLCLHPTSRDQPPASPVTGQVPAPHQLHCTSARLYDIGGCCGPEGRHWEPREWCSESAAT